MEWNEFTMKQETPTFVGSSTNATNSPAFFFEPPPSQISLSINEESTKPHERWEEYKAKGISDQERRRADLLERQKAKRRNITLTAREIVKENKEVQKDEDLTNITSYLESTPSKDSMEYEKQSKQSAAEEKKIAFYRQQFMLPEALFQLPSDLQGGWFAVPYPLHGKRALVISSYGMTTSRLVDGTRLHRFQSALPFGSKLESKAKKDCYSILDCIYLESTNTYYVLDILAWKGHLYYDCETEFRFFWKFAKLEETTAGVVSSNNEIKIVPLPSYECTVEGIKSACTFPLPLEGLFFYNKHTLYTFGTTPLLCSLPMQQVDAVLSPYFAALQQQPSQPQHM